MKAIVFGILAALLFVNTASALNYLSNPSFETNNFVNVTEPTSGYLFGTDVWGITSNAAWGSHAKTGNHSLDVVTVDNTVQGFEQIIPNPITPKASMDQCSIGIFSINLKNFENHGYAPVYIGLRYLNESKSRIPMAVNHIFYPGEDWTKLAVSAKKPAWVEYVQVVIWQRSQVAQYPIAYDDASYEEVAC